MKNSIIILILFSLALILPLYANEKELFPLREVKLGDSAEKLRANYPVVINVTNDVGKEFFLILIKGNKYWKEAWIYTREGKIILKKYFSTTFLSKRISIDSDKERIREVKAGERKGKDKLPLILKDLFAVLGKNFDFGLEKGISSKKSKFCTVLIWEREDYSVGFIHRPMGRGLGENDSPLTDDFVVLSLSEVKKGLFNEYYNLIKDKKSIEELKKEWDAYFSSLEE